MSRLVVFRNVRSHYFVQALFEVVRALVVLGTVLMTVGVGTTTALLVCSDNTRMATINPYILASAGISLKDYTCISSCIVYTMTLYLRLLFKF